MASPDLSRRVRCLVCHGTPTLNNLTTHLRRKDHPGYDGRIGRSRYYVEVGVPLDELPPPPDPDGIPLRTVTKALALPEAPPPSLPPLGLDDLDDIVLAVIGQVAEPTGTIPVEFLSAVFAWREATAVFLRTVGGAD